MSPVAQPVSHPDPHAAAASGGRLVAISGRALALRSATLRADARGGLARVVLEQRFENHCSEALRVTYRMPLPADGAVSAYAFRIGERRICGEVDRRDTARERFETALLEGRSAGIVEQERSSLFSQELGNIPPGAEVVAELTIDQPLAWLGSSGDPGAAGAWEWRFPTAAAPRYLGEAGRVGDAEAVEIDVADRALPVTLTLALCVRDSLCAGAEPESPSHLLQRVPRSEGGFDLSFAAEAGVPLDRDVVVRWRVATAAPELSLDSARPVAGHPAAGRAYGLLAIVPPAPDARAEALPRDLILLIDTSGSMQGLPLEQAQRVAGALVESLGDRDQLELIEFGSHAQRWKRWPKHATPARKLEAQAWIARLAAGGGTEMRSGLLEALAPLRADAQRQVVLVTDGLVGFEREVVAALFERLPEGSRVHCVGIGSAVNRSLTSAVARAGRGVEVVVGLGDAVEGAVRRICARTQAPLLVEVQLDGDALCDAAPSRLPDLYAGAPLRIPLALRPEGGSILVRARTAQGPWQAEIRARETAHGTGSGALAALFARERVEDLEMRLAAGQASAAIDPQIEQLGLDFQIATRLTSWIAIDEIASVDPTQPTRRVRVPQELPYGTSIEGLGLRAPADQVTRLFIMGSTRTSARHGRGEAMPSLRDGDVLAKLLSPPESAASSRVLGRLLAGRSQRGIRIPSQERARGVFHLRGRLLRQRGRELSLEIELDRALDFRHPTRLRVRLADGRMLELGFDPAASTREGPLASGQVLRLELRSLEPIGAALPVEFELETPTGTLFVEL